MYALALVRYRKPLEEVLKVLDGHRAFLRDLKAKGLLIASGPMDPRSGGILLLRVPGVAALDAIRDQDPFTKTGCAQYELRPGFRTSASRIWTGSKRSTQPRMVAK